MNDNNSGNEMVGVNDVGCGNESMFVNERPLPFEKKEKKTW